MKFRIRNALISVYNKENISEFARTLVDRDINIIATRGTANHLRDSGIEVKTVEDLVKLPELMDGRVKTLQSAIFAAILADRSSEEHIAQLEELSLDPIDLVVVNLYPFDVGINENLNENEMIELIDIGGVSLLRAAAKNYRYCISLFSPDQYDEFLGEMEANDDTISLVYRMKQARKLFNHTSEYDRMISNYLGELLGAGLKKEDYPEILSVNFRKEQDLRYGENPHQKGALYRDTSFNNSLIDAEKVSGKEMSYNNWMDSDAAVSVVSEFEVPAVSIVKHAAPCGAGTGENINEAFNKAYITDPISSFGGIIAANRKIDFQTANEITSSFFEVIIAPDYENEALKSLKTKKNLRILKVHPDIFSPRKFKKCYPLYGGVLIQDSDSVMEFHEDWELVSDTKATAKEIRALEFAWKVVKWIKSNGIVLSMENRTIGIGTGQPSRVESVELAIKKAGDQGHYTGGTALASDGFFPFRDAIDEAAKAGVTAVVEPGGSIRDEEVIKAANEHGIALFFTGKRHFRH